MRVKTEVDSNGNTEGAKAVFWGLASIYDALCSCGYDKLNGGILDMAISLVVDQAARNDSFDVAEPDLDAAVEIVAGWHEDTPSKPELAALGEILYKLGPRFRW